MPTMRQTVTYYEDGVGDVVLVIVISDTYAGLVSTSAVDVGCFEIDEASEDLDIDTGIFAADELTFSFADWAAETQDDRDAITFVLQAQDKSTPRYIGLLINPATPIVSENFAFRGIIDTDMSAEDVEWNGDDYDTSIASIREWKGHATSLDIGYVLSQDLKDLVDAIDPSWITANVADRQAYYYDFSPFSGEYTARFGNLVNLHTVIQKLIDLAIPSGSGITMTYQATDTDIWAWPTRYHCLEYDGGMTRYTLTPISYPGEPPIPYTYVAGQEVRLRTGGADTDSGTPFISWRLLTPDGDEQRVSWLRYKSIGELLFSLAAGLGMFVQFTYTTSTAIDVRFVSRSTLKTTQVYVRDATKASLDVKALEVSDKRKRYGGASWQLCREGSVQYNYDGGFVEAIPALRAPEGEDIELAPLTISPTWEFIAGERDDRGKDLEGAYAALLPHGAIFYDPSGPTDRGNPKVDRAVIHSAIYLRVAGDVGAGEVGTFGKWVWTPVAAMYTTIDTQHRIYDQISPWLNDIYQRDAAYYEQEYTLTVPGLCQFRTTPTGPSDWRHAKLSRYIVMDDVEWVIVGLSRSIRERETTLRVHRSSRFAFTPPGAVSPGTPASGTLPADGSTVNLLSRKRYAPGDNLTAFTLVVLLDDGLIYTASPIAEHFGHRLGIALEDFDFETMEGRALVQFGGRVSLGESFPFRLEPGKRLFLRSFQGGTNLSHEPLTARSDTEELYLEIGIAETWNTFKLEFSREFLFE